MQKFIYADNSATTSLSKAALQSMMPFLTTEFGNASSLYSFADSSKIAIENARHTVAEILDSEDNEIYFTASGSEADNWAIKGYAKTMLKKGKNHIISSKFEHHAVLHTLKALEKDGFEITLLDVHSNGIVDPQELKNAIKDTTGLVTIMYANNEIGTIQPISEIGAICREKGVIFHTDAVQAVGNIKIDVKKENIDMLSLSGHKFHGPKGTGVLYIRRGVFPKNLIDGGAQERNKRAGTENTAGIVGLATALKEAVDTMDARNEKCKEIRDYIMETCLKIERSRVNGDRINRLPGNVNMCFEGIEGESLLLMLDAKGVCASSGSACTSGSLDPSHVLLSIGLPHEVAHGSLRLSFSEENTMEDAKYICEILPPIIDRLRSMSPLWDKIKKEEKE